MSKVSAFLPLFRNFKMRSYPIKALALHERVHDFDAASRPLNVLIFTGAFSIQEAHSWLVFCISQIPERCPHGETVTFNFQSTFNGGTILRATYGCGFNGSIYTGGMGWPNSEFGYWHLICIGDRSF